MDKYPNHYSNIQLSGFKPKENGNGSLFKFNHLNDNSTKKYNSFKEHERFFPKFQIGKKYSTDYTNYANKEVYSHSLENSILVNTCLKNLSNKPCIKQQDYELQIKNNIYSLITNNEGVEFLVMIFFQKKSTKQVLEAIFEQV